MAIFRVFFGLALWPLTVTLMQLGVSPLCLYVLLYQIAALVLYSLDLMFLNWYNVKNICHGSGALSIDTPDPWVDF